MAWDDEVNVMVETVHTSKENCDDKNLQLFTNKGVVKLKIKLQFLHLSYSVETNATGIRFDLFLV